MATNYPYFKDLRTNKNYYPHFHQFSDGAFLVDCSSLPEHVDLLRLVVPPTMDVSILAETLNQLTDAFCTEAKYVELYLPYLPYARADRIFGNSQNFGLRSFIRNVLSPLNTVLDLNAVVCNDIHNFREAKRLFYESLPDVDLVNISQLDGLREVYSGDWPNYVVAPDKGAVEKASLIAKEFGVPLVVASKTRDASTGKITGMTLDVPDDIYLLPNLLGLVVDDICDGGGTFLALADLLPSGHKKTLYVTHGIFSKGKSELQDKYDDIISLFDWSKN